MVVRGIEPILLKILSAFWPDEKNRGFRGCRGYGGFGLLLTEAPGLAHHAFPLKRYILKVQEDRQLQIRYRKVSGHLREMSWREGGNNFGVRQNQFINDYIWNQFADGVATIGYREAFLPLHAVPACLKFDDQSSFV